MSQSPRGDQQVNPKANRQQQNPKAEQDNTQLRNRMVSIKHKILILSGKGGVGKSTIAANIAASLLHSDKRVGLLDIDLHGPSIPKLLGLGPVQLEQGENGIIPYQLTENFKVLSIGFMLPRNDQPVIWRGPMKAGAIRQFLQDVDWGELDFLIIDSPPGTGDEPLSICQLLEDADGAIVVTTPQDLAIADVRRSITFCRTLKMAVLGVIENMSGFVCPECGTGVDIFDSGGGEKLANEMNVPFLARIPIDTRLGKASDSGISGLQSDTESQVAQAFKQVTRQLLALNKEERTNEQEIIKEEESEIMRIAIPTAEGQLAMHFGHCEAFVILSVDQEKREILGTESLTPPPHEPGVLPRWLNENQVNLVIAGGMGQRAQGLFREQGIDVIVGASSDKPEQVVRNFLDGTLQTGHNLCDH